MNDTENNNITIVINDYEEPFRTGRSGNKTERPRLPIAAKLIALWNLLFELIIGVPFIFLMAWLGDDCGAGAVVVATLLFVCAHTAASAVSFRRYKLKYKIPAWKFVLLNALPLLFIGALAFVIPWLVPIFGFNFGLGDAIFFVILSVCFSGYSVVYGVLLTAVLGIGHLIERKKS